MILLWLYNLFIGIVAFSIWVSIFIIILKTLIKIGNRHSYVEESHTNIEVTVTDPIVIAKLEHLEALLDNTNEQINQQKRTLDILDRELITLYDYADKNRMEGEILKVKANILKLSDKSSEIGFLINKIGTAYYENSR